MSTDDITVNMAEKITVIFRECGVGRFDNLQALTIAVNKPYNIACPFHMRHFSRL